MSESKQRVSEWLDQSNPELLAYHQKQWLEEKRSTSAFAIFTQGAFDSSATVVDLACGAGAATFAFARKHPGVQVLGLDIAPHCIEIARAQASAIGIGNLSFELGDIYDLERRDGIDGVICLQTLLAFDGYERVLSGIVEKLNPRWMAFSSLFYEGNITCRIEVQEHAKGTHFFYNVYALPEFRRFCASLGYEVSCVERFDIGIDLPKPDNADLMGTYTERVVREDHSLERLQISGPLLMPWHNVLVERSTQ